MPKKTPKLFGKKPKGKRDPWRDAMNKVAKKK